MNRKTSLYARKRLHPEARERSDGITTARMNTTRLSPAELEHILVPLQGAVASARTASATYEQFVQLNTAMHKARAIDDSGVFRGLRTMVDGAEETLNAIGSRAQASGTWLAPTLYGHEMVALDDLAWAYRLMLLEVTYAEFHRAERLAIARVASSGGRLIIRSTAKEGSNS
jgi:hypothetical protein